MIRRKRVGIDRRDKRNGKNAGESIFHSQIAISPDIEGIKIAPAR